MKTVKFLLFFALFLFAGSKSFAQCSLTNNGHVDNLTAVSWSYSFGGCGSGSGTAPAMTPDNVSLSSAACSSETFTVNGYTANAGGPPVNFTAGGVNYQIVLDAYTGCGNAIGHIYQLP